jgi:hypothetical protein
MSGQILICFDEVQSGPKVLKAGKKMARALKKEMTVIHVQEQSGITGYYEKLFRENLDHIDSLFGGAGKEELMFVRKYFSDAEELPRFILRSGDPAGIILEELGAGGYSLAVIGTKDGREPGAVGRKIIEESNVDILLVKGLEDAE